MTASRSTSTLLVCSLVALAGCGGSQLTVHLKLGDDLGGKPPFVQFMVQAINDKEPEVLGPFAIDVVPDGEFASVPPGTLFFIDVDGCPSNVKAECKEAQFNARGCTDFIKLTKDEGQNVTITLHNAVTGAAHCPPPKPV